MISIPSSWRSSEKRRSRRAGFSLRVKKHLAVKRLLLPMTLCNLVTKLSGSTPLMHHDHWPPEHLGSDVFRQTFWCIKWNRLNRPHWKIELQLRSNWEIAVTSIDRVAWTSLHYKRSYPVSLSALRIHRLSSSLIMFCLGCLVFLAAAFSCNFDIS